jgi:hypothetical protein
MRVGYLESEFCCFLSYLRSVARLQPLYIIMDWNISKAQQTPAHTIAHTQSETT